MKAIILAAGMGNRIKHLTDGKPKSFLEVDGKPIIQHQIDSFRNQGIDDITIVVGYEKHHFNVFKTKKVYNPFYRKTNVLGSFWFARKELTEPFVFVHADTYFEEEILKKVLAESGNTMAVEFKECGEEEMKVVVKDGVVLEVSKQLKNADGEFIGLAKFEDYDDIKSKADELVEEFHESFFEHIITELIKEGNTFRAVDISGLVWEEVDFEEDYENLKKALSS